MAPKAIDGIRDFKTHMPFILDVQLNFTRFGKISYEIHAAMKLVRFGHIVVDRNFLSKSR